MTVEARFGELASRPVLDAQHLASVDAPAYAAAMERFLYGGAGPQAGAQ